MNALVVGADRLGNIAEVLGQFGFVIAGHVTGRESTHQRRSAPLPAGIEVVILFTDFVGHNVMQRFREAAGRERVMLARHAPCNRHWAAGPHAIRAVHALRVAAGNAARRGGRAAHAAMKRVMGGFSPRCR